MPRPVPYRDVTKFLSFHSFRLVGAPFVTIYTMVKYRAADFSCLGEEILTAHVECGRESYGTKDNLKYENI